MFAPASSKLAEAPVIEPITAMLAMLVEADEAYLRECPSTPSMNDARPIYWRSAQEARSDIPTILRRGYGDAVDLTAWRVAELRANGENAAIAAVAIDKMAIVVVVREDGRREVIR